MTEQQLREKIASQRAAIAELPSLKSIVDKTGLSSPQTKARAQLIKELSDNEEQLELLVESKRVDAVVKLQDELHPPENPEECPICLETVKHVNANTTGRFYCCGGWICIQCVDERNDNYEKTGVDEMLSSKCPLCRKRFFTDGKEGGAMVLEHSNKGKAWAQAKIGVWSLNRRECKVAGLSLDKKKGWKLIEKAADQGDSDALFLMSKEYVDEELNNPNNYLKQAADLGQLDAQFDLANFYRKNSEPEKYLHYLTLAANQGHFKSCGTFGGLLVYSKDLKQYLKCGPKQCLILAKHYAGKDDLKESVFSAYNFCFATYLLAKERYEGIIEIPGHSPIPMLLFWGRRALEGTVPMKEDIMKLISNVEDKAKSHCANCRTEAGSSSFQRCVRCLGAWYCGKECQVQHWKAGHKIDCIKRKKLTYTIHTH